MFLFRLFRRSRNRRAPLSAREIAILNRENAEASRGGMSPFGLNNGADPMTKALGVGYITVGPTAIIGTPISEESQDQ